jgi:arginyl-tRNA synthetase
VYVVEYLRSIAASFHRFYERVKVIGDDTGKMHARLSLLEALRVVIDCGLRLLGIAPVRKM